MKTIKPLLIFCLLTALMVASCAKHGEKLPTVEVNGTEIPDIDPDLLIPIDVKLSQIAENISVVLLDSNPECMLSSSMSFMLGEKYIIAKDMNGVYQFLIDGTFIRKIITYGRAPGETSVLPILCLVEDDDLLIAVADGVSGKENYQFRLSSGGFLGKNGSVVLDPFESLNSFRYLGDSIIMFSYRSYTNFRNNPNPDPRTMVSGVKIQKMNGEVLFNKEFNYLSWTTPGPDSKVLNGSTIYLLSTNDPKEYILQIIDQDTVYKLNIKNYSVRPFLMKRFEKIIIEGIPVNYFLDNCTLEEEEFANINGYQLMHFRYFESLETGFGSRCFIIYDEKGGMAYKVGTFGNDYFGFLHSTESDIKARHNLPYLIDPGRKLVEVYDAYTFLKLAEEALDNPDLDPTVRTRLLDLETNPEVVLSEETE